MSLRISSLGLAALALAGCSGEAPVQPQAEEGAKPIDCALGEGSEFGPYCRLETAMVDGVATWIVRHPDGGFRRFIMREDGGGLAPMDGADQATNKLLHNDNRIEVVVGSDRYRLPITYDDAGDPQD